jgi:proteasome lid subunit RPN8/RPN11
MNAVQIDERVLRRVEDHARATYPDECCGFLLADVPEPQGRARVIVTTEPARNQFEGDRRRRFVLPSSEFRNLEPQLEGSGRGIVGFYHSHPDHPAEPSAFDLEHAWPWYTYFVTHVNATEEVPTGAFELYPDRRAFERIDLRVSTSGEVGKVGQTLSANGHQ